MCCSVFWHPSSGAKPKHASRALAMASQPFNIYQARWQPVIAASGGGAHGPMRVPRQRSCWTMQEPRAVPATSLAKGRFVPDWQCSEEISRSGTQTDGFTLSCQFRGLAPWRMVPCISLCTQTCPTCCLVNGLSGGGRASPLRGLGRNGAGCAYFPPSAGALFASRSKIAARRCRPPLRCGP
jgi:hypothetical protein